MDPELQRILVYGGLGILAFVSTALVIVWATVGRIVWKSFKKIGKDF
jgi:Flp pilus assembly pilin Flp